MVTTSRLATVKFPDDTRPRIAEAIAPRELTNALAEQEAFEPLVPPRRVTLLKQHSLERPRSNPSRYRIYSGRRGTAGSRLVSSATLIPTAAKRGEPSATL